ncbi:hypothetical protein BASA50_001415 [Batrachochytrium salamandrivorans]|uniref:Uncharacterized protein n=1 Tax=Batrachochytrium salamandrivorans TaxID=1357716 RepID=A0ABQ8EVQ1_9FUNG|nr:hypothetical protein BASA50_001415 [Batrachochytrium salamandrivorans]
MRVGIGIILSVLSFSVLAAVTSNYDYHGPLLVRRAVSPNNRVVLWKRSNEEQTAPVPSNSGAGASTGAGTSVSGSNLDYSSSNLGLSKAERFREFVEKIYKSLKISLNTPKQRMTRWRDNRLIKKAVKRLTEATQGEQVKQAILVVKKFLNITLEGARMTLELYEDLDIIPFFFLPIPKGSTQKSLTKAMIKMQNTGKKASKKYFKDVTSAISNITKHPQDVMKELANITNSISDTCQLFELMYRQDYLALVSKVGHTNNERHIQNTQVYILELKGYRARALSVFNFIKRLINNGKVTFKGSPPSRFANFKSRVKSRLGIKSKSSTGVSSNQEATGQTITPGGKKTFV